MKEYIIQAYAQETIDSFDAHNAPELIRCKDCKHRGTYGCPVYVGGDGMYSVPDDWFCADGERRSEDA